MTEQPVPYEPWWRELDPRSAISRDELTTVWQDASAGRQKEVGVQRPWLGRLVNKTTVDLVGQDWARTGYFLQPGVQCMWLGEKESRGEATFLEGWANVLDVYGEFGDPVARYVINLVNELWKETKPKGLRDKISQFVKDVPRSTASTALHEAMVSGFRGNATPLMETEHRVRSVTDLHRGTRHPDHELHVREVLLAFASDLQNKVDALDDRVGRMKSQDRLLTDDHVANAVSSINAAVQAILEKYAADLPSGESVAESLEELLDPVVKWIARLDADERSAIERGLELAPRAHAQLELYSACFESTRADLAELLERGESVRTDEPTRMFHGRLNEAVDRYLKDKQRPGKPTQSHGGGSEDDGSDGTDEIEQSEQTSSLPDLEIAVRKLFEFRSDLKLTLGSVVDGKNTAEFDIALAALKENAGGNALLAMCKTALQDPSARPIGRTSEALLDNVRLILTDVFGKMGYERK